MNKSPPAYTPELLDTLCVEEVDPVVVGPGCLRRDLPGPEGLRVWMVDMAPGSVWPVVDEHGAGEAVYVVAGEVIEDDQRFGMGTYLYFRPGSRHQPRTEKGAQLFGINPRRRE
ncbi:MAG TPA: cupin domain-containing protein [Rhodanobacteraceae bacterium]|nr:cupin domain-containing protein [Rhodanobacteraceae bacterium]